MTDNLPVNQLVEIESNYLLIINEIYDYDFYYVLDQFVYDYLNATTNTN